MFFALIAHFYSLILYVLSFFHCNILYQYTIKSKSFCKRKSISIVKSNYSIRVKRMRCASRKIYWAALMQQQKNTKMKGQWEINENNKTMCQMKWQNSTMLSCVKKNVLTANDVHKCDVEFKWNSSPTTKVSRLKRRETLETTKKMCITGTHSSYIIPSYNNRIIIINTL